MPFYALAENEHLTYEIKNEEVTITGCDKDYSGVLVIPDVINGYPVTEIDSYAFKNCNNITEVVIGANVESINHNAFEHSYNIKSVTISDSVDYIGYEAFYSCLNLEKITILPQREISIRNDSFDNTAYYKNEANWEDGLLYIDNHLIDAKSGFTEFNVKADTFSIAKYAFFSCSRLESVTLPDSITVIGDSMFKSCSDLKSVTFGKNVTTIGNSAFYECRALEEIVIPDSVTSMGYLVFYGCDKLKSIVIPDSVTSSVGEGSFRDCSALESVVIGDGATSIDNKAFYRCRKLKTVVIGDNVQSIGESAFQDCESLENITMNNVITSIGDMAFENCNKVTSIELPLTLKSIGKYAFYWMLSLTDVYYGGSEEDWKNVSIGNSNNHLHSATIHYTENNESDDTDSPQNPDETNPETEDELILISGTDVAVDSIGFTVNTNNVLTAFELKSLIENDNVLIVDKNNIPVDDEQKLGTGNKIQLMGPDNGVIAEYTIVLRADVNGDSKITAADARIALRVAANLDKLEGAYLTAANQNDDEKITASDARKILRKAAGLE